MTISPDFSTFIKIFSLCWTVLLIVAYIVYFIVKIIKKIRNNASTNTTDSATQSNILDTIYDAMIEFIPEAENIYTAMGSLGVSKTTTQQLKANYVLDKVRLLCYENNTQYDKEYWNNELTKLVSLTKEVNVDSSEELQSESNKLDNSENVKNIF